MFDLPPNLPPPVPAHAAIIEKCSVKAGRIFNVHPYVLQAISKVEGGKIGTFSKNSNGSYDMGIMQINTINLPRIKKEFPTISWKKIAYSPCVNIGVAAWILSEELKREPVYWKGVGNYHSRTPKYRNIYLKKIHVAYKSVLKKMRKRIASKRVISISNINSSKRK